MIVAPPDLTDPATAMAIRDLARADLYFYTRYTYARRHGSKWVHNWHHAIICAALMRVFNGQCKRLIINLPPRYSKTELAVLNFISWAMGKVPDAQFIHVSYSATLAENNSSNTQNILTHESYNEIFPGTVLATNAKSHWKTTAGGVMYATGAGGTITGFGAGRMREGFAGAILIDDPHKADQANSDAVRKGVLDWYGNTLASRVNHPDTPIILIMQRLHEDDLSGFLLGGGSGEEWEHLCLPAYSDEYDALWPWKHSAEKLKQMEASQPWVFAGQYQQVPAPLGGGIFKVDWWKYWRGWENRDTWPKFSRIVQSIDTAFKTGQENDFSVIATWGEGADGYYLIDLFKAKLEMPDLRRAVVSQANKYRPHAILIEDKASGQSLLQDLRRDTRLPVIAVPVNRDKVARANEVTPTVEAGRCFLPEGHPETANFVLSHAQFPNAKNDDDVDTTTQVLAYFTRGNVLHKVAMVGF